MSLSALYRLIWSWLGWFPDTVQSLCEFWEKLNAQRGVSKLKICHFCIIVNHKSWDSNICLWLSAEDESGGTAADTSVSHGNVTKQNLTSIKLSSSRTLNCPPAPNVHKRFEQEDRRQFSLCLCWRPHSHCQLTEVDLSRSSFMTTAEPRWQSVRLAGCCLSYQAVVRVVHPAAPCLPPSARCCWGALSADNRLDGSDPVFVFVCLRVDTVYELCSQTEVSEQLSQWLWRLWLKAKHQEL